MKWKRGLSCLLAAMLALLPSACDKKADTLEASADFSNGFLRTAATDDAGRSFGDTPGYRTGKFVGLFYFLWNGTMCNQIYDVDSYLKSGKLNDVLTGVTAAHPLVHHWGESLYGYYQGTDKWVIRKHVELFMNAGIDFLCLDTSNDSIYEIQGAALLDVLLEYADLGYPVPKVLFLTNTDSAARAEQIYDKYYKSGKYDKVWFRGTGTKPWILASGLGADLSQYFYAKPAQWPNAAPVDNSFPWISWNYPQEQYADKQLGNIMSVSVSQHVGLIEKNGVYADFSDSGAFSPTALAANAGADYIGALKSSLTPERVYNANWGRGYSQETKQNDSGRAIHEGTNFESQWDTALDADNNVSLVFVTGWNEWVAQKQVRTASKSGVFEPSVAEDYRYFVDTFNTEFSRDIEMSAEYLDLYYLSLVRNVRLFKAVEGDAERFDGRTQDLTKTANWKNVTAVYKDLVGETEARNTRNAAGTEKYINRTGRNDIEEIRVASDADNVYFLVRTAADITAREEGDTRYMNLFLGVPGKGGWQGLQYVVNRTPGKLTKIENESFGEEKDCSVSVDGRFMIVSVKKSDLGISDGAFDLEFKVADNLQKDFDVAELYVNGDCAPIGRMNYVYRAK